MLHAAEQAHQPATMGPYAWIRHPQYLGFIVAMVGFLLQWPTLLTLLMFPVLVVMCVRLARTEERDTMVEFGDAYPRCTATTPDWFPRWPESSRPRNGGRPA